MRASHGYRPIKQQTRQQRPLGVTIMAGIGVVGSLLTMAVTLLWLWTLLGVSIGLSRQLAVVAGALVLALVLIWVNWGVWELVRWAWWANLMLTLLGAVGLFLTMRYVPDVATVLARLRPGVKAGALTGPLTIGLLVALVYHLVVAVYMVSVHAVFGVGVKDERPIWERVHRQ